jgi:hypothetical protein
MMLAVHHHRIRSVAAMALLALTGAAQAQPQPGLTAQGAEIRVARDSAADRVVQMVYQGRYSFVRIETREPGAALNRHPVAIDAATLRRLLALVQWDGGKVEPLFTPKELDEIATPLAAALARATPEQDVSFAVSDKHGFLGPFANSEVTTARVFHSQDRLNLIFGLARRDFESQFRASGYLIAFEPGQRAAPVDRHVKLRIGTGGTRARADWIAIDPQAALLAAESKPAVPAVPTPAPAVTIAPAPAAPAQAAAPATPAAPPPSALPPAPASGSDALYRKVADRLTALQKLRDEKLISEQEYQERRKAILAEI